MFGLLYSARARSLVMFFLVAGLFAGGSVTWARNRRVRNVAPQQTVAPNQNKVTESIAEYPTPHYSGYTPPQTDLERADREAAIAEVRRAVGESPVDRVKDLQNPVNSVVPENDYEHPYGTHVYPEGETVIKEPGETRIITRRNGEFTERVIGDPPATAVDTTVVTSRAERLLNSKNADWLQDAPRNFGGISWCPPPYEFPENSRQLVTAGDDGLHDDLDLLNQLAAGDALRQQIEEAAYTTPSSARILGDWNEKPAVRLDSVSRFEALPTELRGVARKLDARAADLEDVHQFADADHLRTLAESLRQEARRQESQEARAEKEEEREIFSFNTSMGR